MASVSDERLAAQELRATIAHQVLLQRADEGGWLPRSPRLILQEAKLTNVNYLVWLLKELELLEGSSGSVKARVVTGNINRPLLKQLLGKLL